MSDPMDLVSHVNRSKTGMTKMQVQLSIEMRAGLAEASKRLSMSQLSIIRAAISAFLQDHGGWEAWNKPPVPASEAPGSEMVPVAQPIMVETPPAVENLAIPKEIVHTEPIILPEIIAPKKPRTKRGKS